MSSKQPLKISSKPKVVRPHSLRRTLAISGVALLVAIIAAQAVLFWDLYQRTALRQDDASNVKMLIARAIDGQSRDAVIEGATNKVYFPENRLSMQAVLHSPRLVYVPNDDGLQLAQKNIINARVSRLMSGQSTEQTFDRVPALQACSRQFQIQFVSMPASQMQQWNVTAVMTKQLVDGRTAHVYRDLGCDDAGELVRPLFDSLQSY